jgi:hypothetical protein
MEEDESPEPAFTMYAGLNEEWLRAENARAIREMPTYEGNAPSEIGTQCGVRFVPADKTTEG